MTTKPDLGKTVDHLCQDRNNQMQHNPFAELLVVIPGITCFTAAAYGLSQVPLVQEAYHNAAMYVNNFFYSSMFGGF